MTTRARAARRRLIVEGITDEWTSREGVEACVVAFSLKLVASALAVGLAALPAPAGAQPLLTGRWPLESTLTVGGTATLELPPDQARVTATIVTDDPAASKSVAANAATFANVRSRALALGIASQAIRTSSYSVDFVPFPPKTMPPEQRQPRYGYITTRLIVILVTPPEAVGKLVDAATAAGATSLGVAFELRDPHAAYVAALAAAVRDARTTAATLAAAGGFRLVRLRRVEVADQYAVPLRVAGGMRSMAGPEPATAPTTPPTQIDPNAPIVTSARLTVDYEIR